MKYLDNTGLKYFADKIKDDLSSTEQGEKIVTNALEAIAKNINIDGNIYQAGIPSPDNPQKNEVINNHDEINEYNLQDGHIGIKQSGKNIIPTSMDKWEQGTINTNTGKKVTTTKRLKLKECEKIKESTQYYFSLKSDYIIQYIAFYNQNKIFISSETSLNNKSNGAFTTPPETMYFIATIKKIKEPDVNVNDINYAMPQVEEGQIETSYEPYHETLIYDIDLKGNELCEIGDIKDELDVITGVLTKRIGKLVLDGSETITKLSQAINSYKIVKSLKTTHNDDTINYCCNYFKAISTSERYKNLTFFINTDGDIVVSYNDITTLSDFKIWLSTHNVTIYYILEIPQIIQLVPTQVELWEGINILETMSNLETNFIIEYYKFNAMTNNIIKEIVEIKNKIPTKTSELINNNDYVDKTYVDGLIGNINTILATLTEVNE